MRQIMRTALVALAIGGAVSSTGLAAATLTWRSSASAGANWSDANNWDLVQAPTDGDSLIFAIPVLLLLFLFQSQRKRQRAFTSLQDQLQPGQEVLTTSGLYARIVSLDERVVVLETGPGQSVRWDRRAIASVVPDAAATTDGTDLPPHTPPAAEGPDAPNEK